MSDPFAGKMPAEVAPEFNALRPAVGDLYSTWRMYTELFGNKEYAALINDSDSAAFLILHRALRGDILMAFGRLLDPPDSKGGKVRNLSLPHLVRIIQPHCDPAFNGRLEEMLKTAEKQCEPLRKWRDKRFGHADRDHTPPLGSEKLPDIDEKQIEVAVAMLRAILKEIFTHFNGSAAEFPFPVLESCADELMQLVRDGVRFRETEVEEMLGLKLISTTRSSRPPFCFLDHVNPATYPD
jgi:hypothetical protein